MKYVESSLLFQKESFMKYDQRFLGLLPTISTKSEMNVET